MEKFKKFTEEQWYEILDNGDFSKYLVDEVNHSLNHNLADYNFCLVQNLWQCESPIEQLFYIEILRLTYCNIKCNPYVDIIAIDSQVEVKCGNNKYRVDFLIPVEYKNPINNRIERKFYVVECDGHDFHEKTKQQVIKNNERTRKLQEYGYEVVRYSGSEIYHTAYRCALSLLDIIYNHFWDKIIKED